MNNWTPTDKQKAFVEEYVKDLNAARAAKAAGYYGVHYRSLMKNKHVLKMINAKLEKNDIFVGPTIPRILTELMRIAFFDPKDLFNDDGTPKALSDIPEDARRCIAGIEFSLEGKGEDAVTMKKFKLADKHKALENLGRHLAMFTDKLKLDIPTELESMSDEQLADTVRQLAEATGLSLGVAETTKTKH